MMGKTETEQIDREKRIIQVFSYDYNGETRVLEDVFSINQTVKRIKVMKNSYNETMEVKGNAIIMYDWNERTLKSCNYNCINPTILTIVLEDLNQLEKKGIRESIERIFLNLPEETKPDFNTKGFFLVMKTLFPKMTEKQFQEVKTELNL